MKVFFFVLSMSRRMKLSSCWNFCCFTWCCAKSLGAPINLWWSCSGEHKLVLPQKSPRKEVNSVWQWCVWHETRPGQQLFQCGLPVFQLTECSLAQERAECLAAWKRRLCQGRWHTDFSVSNASFDTSEVPVPCNNQPATLSPERATQFGSHLSCYCINYYLLQWNTLIEMSSKWTRLQAKDWKDLGSTLLLFLARHSHSPPFLFANLYQQILQRKSAGPWRRFEPWAMYWYT